VSDNISSSISSENSQKIFILDFSIFLITFPDNSNLLFINISAQTFSKSLAKAKHTSSSLSIDLAIFKNIKYDFSLFHHFHDIIAAITFDQDNPSSIALAIL